MSFVHTVRIHFELCIVFTDEKLCPLVEEFERVCKKNLRVNRKKNTVITCTSKVVGTRMNVALNSELLKKMECFTHFGSKITVNGGMGT